MASKKREFFSRSTLGFGSSAHRMSEDVECVRWAGENDQNTLFSSAEHSLHMWDLRTDSLTHLSTVASSAAGRGSGSSRMMKSEITCIALSMNFVFIGMSDGSVLKTDRRKMLDQMDSSLLIHQCEESVSSITVVDFHPKSLGLIIIDESGVLTHLDMNDLDDSDSSKVHLACDVFSAISAESAMVVPTAAVVSRVPPTSLSRQRYRVYCGGTASSLLEFDYNDCKHSKQLDSAVDLMSDLSLAESKDQNADDDDGDCDEPSDHLDCEMEEIDLNPLISQHTSDPSISPHSLDSVCMSPPWIYGMSLRSSDELQFTDDVSKTSTRIAMALGNGTIAVCHESHKWEETSEGAIKKKKKKETEMSEEQTTNDDGCSLWAMTQCHTSSACSVDFARFRKPSEIGRDLLVSVGSDKQLCLLGYKLDCLADCVSSSKLRKIVGCSLIRKPNDMITTGVDSARIVVCDTSNQISLYTFKG